MSDDPRRARPAAMSVVSTGPLRAASRAWLPAPNRWALTVVCKATFRLMPGESPLDPEQEEPNEDDNYWDDDPTRSLYSPGDMIPFKERADIVLVGHAFAPGGVPARSILTRLVVGDVDKMIEAFCDRSFTLDGQLREGPKVTKVSLGYERAAGGPSTPNPAGVRLDTPDMYGAVHLPNLQPPGLHITSRSDFIAPVGYGPVAPTWPARLDKLGPYRGRWDPAKWDERPLPDGFDLGFFNVAPRDQQVGALRDRERIVLENLHPEHPRLVTSLCGVRPTATVKRAGQPPELIAMLPDTLWIDSTRGICTLVWRGLIHLRFRDEAGEVILAMEGSVSDAVGFHRQDTIPPPPLEDAEDAVSVTQTIAPDEAVAALGDPDSGETVPIRVDWARPKPVMPFVASSPKPPQPAAPPGPVLPWPSAPPPVPAMVGSMAISEMAPAPIAPPAQVPLPTLVQPPAPVAPIAQETPPVQDAQPVEEAPAPAIASPSPAPAPGPEEPAIPERTLEECAAIAAKTARRKADAAAILEEHKLTAPAYAAVDRRWTDAIRQETTRGKTALLKAYDDAYVAELEKERGPILVEEYARLVVAAERGMAESVLSELTLPRGAMMRIERVWLSKIADDPALADRTRKAIEAARKD